MSPDQPRIPNFKRLLVSGAMIGLIVGVIVAVTGDDAQGYSQSSAMLYLGALGAFVGTGLAGLLGIALDRSGRSH